MQPKTYASLRQSSCFFAVLLSVPGQAQELVRPIAINALDSGQAISDQKWGVLADLVNREFVSSVPGGSTWHLKFTQNEDGSIRTSFNGAYIFDTYPGNPRRYELKSNTHEAIVGDNGLYLRWAEGDHEVEYIIYFEEKGYLRQIRKDNKDKRQTYTNLLVGSAEKDSAKISKSSYVYGTAAIENIIGGSIIDSKRFILNSRKTISAPVSVAQVQPLQVESAVSNQASDASMHVVRQRVGISESVVPELLDVGLATSSGTGIIVNSVALGGPAFKAGVRPGDLILSVNGLAIGRDLTIGNIVKATATGSNIVLNGFRYDQPIQFIVTPVLSNDSEIGEYIGNGVVDYVTYSASKGSVHGSYLLGIIYYDGLKVPQDFQKALRWFESAAKAGSAPAKTYLGNMYSKGLGTPQDSVTAEKLYREAASAGEPAAVKYVAALSVQRQREQEAANRTVKNKSGGGLFGKMLGAAVGGAVTGWSAEGMITGMRMAQGGDSAQQEYDRLNAQSTAATRQAAIADANLQASISRARQSAPVQSALTSQALKKDLDPAVVKQLAAANAYRDARLAISTDPTERAQLLEQNRQADAVAKQYAIENRVRGSASTTLASSFSPVVNQRPSSAETGLPQSMAAATLCRPAAGLAGTQYIRRVPCSDSVAGPTGGPSAGVAKASGNSTKDGTRAAKPRGVQPSPVPSPSATPKPSPADVVVDWEEGVAVCKPGTGGSYRCDGPLQVTYAKIGTKFGEGDLGNACGTSYSKMRDLGSYGGHRVFACGFGIHPTNRSYPGNKDTLAINGLGPVPGMRTYRCPTSQAAYCSTQ